MQIVNCWAAIIINFIYCSLCILIHICGYVWIWCDFVCINVQITWGITIWPKGHKFGVFDILGFCQIDHFCYKFWIIKPLYIISPHSKALGFPFLLELLLLLSSRKILSPPFSYFLIPPLDLYLAGKSKTGILCRTSFTNCCCAASGFCYIERRISVYRF